MGIRVVICNQLPIECKGLCFALESVGDIAVVGVTGDGLHALELVRRTHPDVVLTDIPLSSISGIELTRRLAGQVDQYGVRVVIFTLADDRRSVLEALDAGARGFVAKQTGPHDLARAVRAVVNGDVALEPVAARWLLEDLLCGDRTVTSGPELDGLTRRELEVLGLVGAGRSNNEIAESLSVTLATVRSHVYNLRRKLAARDRSQLALIGYRVGRVAEPGQLRRSS
jgi:DNA-binding NarL/FixJ family response regulator